MKTNAKTIERLIVGARYSVEGVIALRDGQALVGGVGDSERQVVVEGKRLAELGFSVKEIAKMIRDEYLIPVTNQDKLAEALPAALEHDGHGHGSRRGKKAS
jgi:hypothetical protein